LVINTASGEVLTLSDAPGVVAAAPETLDQGAAVTVPSRALLVLQRTE
jgi:glycogen operon protein